MLGSVAGTALYYLIAPTAGRRHYTRPRQLHFGFRCRLSIHQGYRTGSKISPIALPFGLLTVIGGINVTEARASRETITVLETSCSRGRRDFDAASAAASRSPRLHRPTAITMGSRAGYTLLTGLFIGIGGMSAMFVFVEIISRVIARSDICGRHHGKLSSCPAKARSRSRSPTSEVLVCCN